MQEQMDAYGKVGKRIRQELQPRFVEVTGTAGLPFFAFFPGDETFCLRLCV